jgi:hypothetical protein
MKLTVITKTSCKVSRGLLEFLDTLPQVKQENIYVLDNTTSSLMDLYNIIDSYDTYGFPTLILHDANERVITGFSEQTKDIIKNYMLC